MAKLSAAELAKREDVIQKMKKNKRSLVKRYGPDAEKVMYGRATNIAKKVAETQMEKTNLKELVRAALMQEKAGFSKEFDNDPALKGGQKNLPDGLQKAIISKAKGKMEEAINQAIVLTDKDHDLLKKNGSVAVRVGDQTVVVALKDFDVDMEDYEDPNLEEDLDLGHTDNEPHMLKGDLYRIGKYAMELYQMVDQFEGMGEVDFPHWWQSKIIKAKEMISSAKHYLDFETKEPEIDAMVGAIDMSGALDNVGVDEGLPKGYFKKATAELDENQVDMFATKASRTDNAKETYFKFLKDFAKSAGVSGEELGKMSYNDLENKFGEKLSRKYGLKKSNVADRARELVSKGVIQVDESFEKLVGKLKKQGKSEKAAKAIAGAVASYKAKGGGKGPTAKQKARG
jgi:hypothetical protein